MIKRFFVLLTAITLPLTGMQILDGDLTFNPPPKPKPSVLGLQFGSSQKEVISFMLPFTTKKFEKKELQGGKVVLLTFDGVPEGLPVENGKSLFFFHRNQLAKVLFQLLPSYESFLLLRASLTESLSERYHLSEQHETIDHHLRQHLANLDSKNLGGKTEGVIQSSIKEGKTFFSYIWNDKQKELDIALSYTANRSDRLPSLILQYDYLPTMEQVRKTQQKINKNPDRSLLVPKRR